MNNEKIGLFIVLKRKELKMTQKELADKLHVTNKAISKWERGLGCPDVSLLGELSNILNIGIGELLNGEEDANLKDNSEFILNAVNFSKKKTQNDIYMKISKILIILAIFISGYLLVVNIKQMIFLDSYKEYNFDTNEIKELNILTEVIEKKVLKIAENSKKENIVKITYESVQEIKRHPFLINKSNTKIYNKDLYDINLRNENIDLLSEIFVTVISKDEKIKEIYKIFDQFKYNRKTDDTIMHNNKIYSTNMYDYKNVEKYNVEQQILHLSFSLNRFNKVLDLIMEVDKI